MKIFLSSTFRDLVPERDAVLKALIRKRESVNAMEYFGAEPSTPLNTALQHLRDSDVVLLVIGFKAGSLVPNTAGTTYTQAEYQEAVALGRPILAFLKNGKKSPRSNRIEWLNKERSQAKIKALEDFKREVGARYTWYPFTNPDQLALGVNQSLEKWESQGRPGARKTFSSASDFFTLKAIEDRHSDPRFYDDAAR